ncbi:MAG: hypothetical protein ABW046_05830 [Actinoplanes sp.]
MRVNDVVRRPDVYSRDETAERLLLEAMAAVDDSLPRWEAELDRLRDQGAMAPTGVQGAYSYALPADMLRYATATVYAEVAHRCGWLQLDRVLSAAEYQHLAAVAGEWMAEDRTLSEVIETFGPPSMWTLWTPTYATADPEDSLITFHPENTRPNPKVLAVRHRPATYTFTPEGLRRHPTRSLRA